MEPTTDLNLKVERTDRTSWIKLLMGGGLGVFIAIVAVRYLMDEGAKDNEFLRTTVKDNTIAIGKAADAMNRTADELDDMSDAQRELMARLGPLPRSLNNLAEAVTEQVAQDKEGEEAKP